MRTQSNGQGIAAIAVCPERDDWNEIGIDLWETEGSVNQAKIPNWRLMKAGTLPGSNGEWMQTKINLGAMLR